LVGGKKGGTIKITFRKKEGNDGGGGWDILWGGGVKDALVKRKVGRGTGSQEKGNGDKRT